MKKAKVKEDTPQWLVTLGAIGAIFFGIYPIIGNSFKLFSTLRLQKLNDAAATELIAGYWDGNGGFILYGLLLVIGFWLMKRGEENPVVFTWTLISIVLVFLILMVYFINTDFPHNSSRADLLSEVMMVGLLMLFFPIIIDFVITSISKKAYNERFWMIIGIYTIVYLFVWPAMIGDLITIVSISR